MFSAMPRQSKLTYKQLTYTFIKTIPTNTFCVCEITFKHNIHQKKLIALCNRTEKWDFFSISSLFLVITLSIFNLHPTEVFFLYRLCVIVPHGGEALPGYFISTKSVENWIPRVKNIGCFPTVTVHQFWPVQRMRVFFKFQFAICCVCIQIYPGHSFYSRLIIPLDISLHIYLRKYLLIDDKNFHFGAVEKWLYSTNMLKSYRFKAITVKIHNLNH